MVAMQSTSFCSNMISDPKRVMEITRWGMHKRPRNWTSQTDSLKQCWHLCFAACQCQHPHLIHERLYHIINFKNVQLITHYVDACIDREPCAQMGAIRAYTDILHILNPSMCHRTFCQWHIIDIQNIRLQQVSWTLSCSLPNLCNINNASTCHHGLSCQWWSLNEPCWCTSAVALMYWVLYDVMLNAHCIQVWQTTQTRHDEIPAPRFWDNSYQALTRGTRLLSCWWSPFAGMRPQLCKLPSWVFLRSHNRERERKMSLRLLITCVPSMSWPTSFPKRLAHWKDKVMNVRLYAHPCSIQAHIHARNACAHVS